MIRVLFRAPPAVRDSYRFRGAAGPVAWPREDGVGLGPPGAWNFFWRLGARPRRVSAEAAEDVPADGILVAIAERENDRALATLVERWHARGNWIIAAGTPSAFPLLPAGAEVRRSPYPYAALAYRLAGRTEIMAPPAGEFARWQGPAGEGELVALGGERQSPERALALPLAAPAIVASERFLYLNANPFAAFQSWLQGQSDLGPWLGWRPRLHWLDEHVAALWRMLLRHVPPLANLQRPGVPGLGATTVVLRHDLDYSRDTTYLDLALARRMPASYAVLRDRNRRFWTRRLARAEGIECCFHYNTMDRTAELASELGRRARRFIGHQAPPPALKPGLGDIVGAGLRRQVTKARAAGIGIATLHRHGAFLVYPEWIDALDATLAEFPDILGSSSLFRGIVLRWGARRVDGGGGTLFDFPEAGFPLWFPFKLARADSGLALRGWESTHIAESEPGLVAQLLYHRIPELPQRVVTLSYHPYHAARPTFCALGSRAWFAEILDLIAERKIEALALAEVYARVERAAAADAD
ncbi:MAG TPA: hypothetical protein VLV50_14690 [Stellaceae bacterium]|nr:hypothetical protein [Stellaceae bacterium]